MALTYIKTSGLDPAATFTIANVDISSNLTVANANVTNLATFASINVTGNVSSGGNFIGNGQYLTGVVATNAQTVTTAAQPNITSVGTLSSVTVTGLVTATAGGVKVGNIKDSTGTNTISVSSTTVGIIGNLEVGTGGSGNITGNNATLTGLLSTNNISEVKGAPAISTGSLTLDLNTASIFEVSLDATITSISISNVQSSGRVSSFVLIFTADGTARSVTWPASFKWPSGTAPTITSTSGKKDVFVFFTVDGGTTWQAFISGQDL